MQQTIAFILDELSCHCHDCGTPLDVARINEKMSVIEIDPCPYCAEVNVIVRAEGRAS